MSAYSDDSSPSGKRPYSIGRPSTGSHHQLVPMAMEIPGRQKPQVVPPPVPPPRHVDVDMDSFAAGGHSPRWQWDNEGSFGKSRGPAPAMDSFPKSWARSRDDERTSYLADNRRRQSDNESIRFGKEPRYDPTSRFDEGYHSMSVGLPSINSQLHGEQQLHHRGQEKSSQAYDNKLLSKIGKPKTPPRTGSFASAESSPTSSLTFARQPPPSSRSLSFPNSMTSAYSESPVKREPGLRFGDSPQSRPVSPGTFPSAPDGRNFGGYRSPTLDAGTRSSTLESEAYSPYHQRFPPSSSSANDTARPAAKGRRSIGQSSLSNVDESASSGFPKITTSLPVRAVKRESYEHIFSEPETFRMVESVDRLRLDDRSLPPVHRDSVQRNSAHSSSQHLHSQRSMIGMKRKQDAMASPSEVSHDGPPTSLQQMAGAASNFAQNAPSHLSPSFAQHQGSISSQSSTGFRNGSYASSGGPSIGESSYTSLDQQSPGGVSPSEQQQQQHQQQQQQQHYQQQMAQDAQYNQSLSMDPSSRAGPYPDTQQQPLDSAFGDTKPPPPRKEARRSNAPTSLSTSIFMCGCCPKKPRKFETLEEKMQHEAEKQYSCAYCTNRFKNKNEAERHQNSLHLRRHSWSCAILASNYAAAFFPSSELPNPTAIPGHPEPMPAANDTCGYCGREFTNDPQPDWDDRTRHLDMDHKFRECNQSKKFFRADHFRQHLKHSHQGASGKWTNRLEQACIKEEPPAIPLDQQNQSNENTPTQSAPVANMGSMNQQDMSQQSPTPMHQHAPQVPNPSSANYSPHASMMNQQTVPQLDMTNIDPSIGIQQMGNMVSVSTLGGMAPPPPSQRQQQMQAGVAGGYDELKTTLKPEHHL